MSNESSLIIWARGLAERATLDPIIKAAKEAAATLCKVVVQTGDDAERVTSLLNDVRKGKSNAKKALDDILRDPKAAIKEAKDQLDPIIKAFEEVEAAGKSAVARYLVEQQAVARKAEQQAREVEAERAKAEPDLPMMEVEPVAVQSIVRTESGGSTNLVKRLKVELLDAVSVAEFDSTLLKLLDSEALATYRHYEKRDQLDGAKPHPSGGTEWRGMRFYDDITVAIRGGK